MNKHYIEMAEELDVEPEVLEPIADKHGFVNPFEAIELASLSERENAINLENFDDYESPDVHRVDYFVALKKVEEAKLLNLKRKQLEKELIEIKEIEAWITERGLLLRETLLGEINTIIDKHNSGTDLKTVLKEHFTKILQDPFGLAEMSEILEEE